MSLATKAKALLAPRARPRGVGPIGVDFALESLHLVQLETGPDGMPAVRARTSQSYRRPRKEILDNPLILRTLMKNSLAKDRFVGRKCVVAIPSRLFRTVSINFQSPPGKDNEAQAVLKAMKDRVDGDLSDYVLDYLPVSGQAKSDERLALVAVSEQKPIVDQLEPSTER